MKLVCDDGKEIDINGIEFLEINKNKVLIIKIKEYYMSEVTRDYFDEMFDYFKPFNVTVMIVDGDSVEISIKDKK